MCRLLTKDDIEVKVKKIDDGYAVLLLYKTARVDMAILDEKYGTDGWCDDYKEIKGNMYCGIGIWSDKTNQWIWKWDCGIESREDNEGNQKKGEASDAFKRAGFKWGIGRELYTAPSIYINCETELYKGFYRLKDRRAKFSVSEIEYNDKREITKLIIVDRFGKVVYPSSEQPKQTKQNADSKNSTESQYKQITDKAKANGYTTKQVDEWIKIKYKKAISYNSLTKEQFDELMIALENGAKKNEQVCGEQGKQVS